MVNLTTWLPAAVFPPRSRWQILSPRPPLIVTRTTDPMIPAAKQVRRRLSGRPRTSPVLRNPGALQRALGRENKRFVGSDERCRLDWPGLPLPRSFGRLQYALSVPAKPGDLGRVIDPDQPAPDTLS